VLSRIEQCGADLTICLGDVATLGPEPERVLELLQQRRAVCVLGNHDEFMIRPEAVAEYTSIPVLLDSIAWCRTQLSAASVEAIRGFRATYELELENGERLFTYHGTPASNTTDLLATSAPEQVEKWVGNAAGSVLAGGHTHLQMLRQHRGRLLINPGSVGMPFEEYAAGGPPKVLPHAEYAWIESRARSVKVSLERIALDKSALRKSVRAVDFPLARFLASAYA